MNHNITIRDVAKAAGVSVATVSNVINNIDKVSAETKQRIIKIMQELDYHPNLTARTLNNKKSKMIGIMLPVEQSDGGSSILLKDNPYYSEILSGIELEAEQTGYDVLITGLRAVNSCYEWIKKRNLDGVIFLGVYNERYNAELSSAETPVTLIDTYGDAINRYDNVGINDFEGGKISTEYLLDLGHKNIAIASDKVDWSDVNRMRFEGYKTAMRNAGIQKLNRLYFQDSTSFEGGYRIGMQLLNRLDEVSAVVTTADILALGIIKALEDNGKSVPDDLSIIGFDDLNLCKFINKKLTTVRQNIFQKGMTAVKLLVERIEKSVQSPPNNVVLPVELVVRDTTKAFSD